MSRLIKRIQNLIKKIDLFPATQFVKYKQQSDYKTATGGCVSFTVIIVFLVLFYNLGIKTINQDIIYSEVNYQIQLEPPYMTVEINKSPDFLFAIGVLGINLNDPNVKFFNITLRQFYQNPSFQIINSTSIPLVQCSKDHFSANPQIQSLYTKFKVQYALCPAIGSSFEIGGRQTSDIYAQATVSIDYCDQAIDPKCAGPVMFQMYEQFLGGFTLFAPVISTIVNPGEKVYKQVFVQDQNFFFFSSTLGIRVNGQIQQYQIETDVSLMPYNEIQTEYVNSLPGLLSAKTKPVVGTQYASVVFDRSSVQTTYSRSFNKVDSYFSYVGGLVGTVLLLFFIMSSYSDMSFSIDMANELFLLTEKDDIVPQFSFFYYFTSALQQWFSCCICTKNWKTTSLFKEAAEEMDKQLDISHILKRMYYIQEGLQALLTNSQLETLYLKRKKNIQEAAKMRKKLQYNFVVNEKQEQMSPQSKCRDSSSIVQAEGLNLQESKHQIHTDQQQYYRIDIDNCEQISSSIVQQSSSIQQQKQKMKDCLNQVIKDSKENNKISIRILQKLNPKMMSLTLKNNEEQ